MKRLLPIIAGILLVTGALALVVITEPEPVTAKEQPAAAQPVSVVKVSAVPFAPTLTLLGTTSPRWQNGLKAQSSAELNWLSENSEPGTLVKKGELLASLDTTQLKAQLAQADGELKQAELQLLREKHEQTVALKMLSGKKSSAYARKEPQIAAAKAALAQAKRTLASARKQLEDAQIRAPFDAVILSRKVSPAQHVEQGQLLFDIASSDSLDVSLPVAESQWQKLSGALNKPQITVEDRQHQSWPADVRYITPVAQNTTRQREVVLSVEKPYHTSPRLLPGQQVKVRVQMPQVNNAMQLPASALTRDGEVWYVQNNQLVKKRVRILEQHPEHVWVLFENAQPQTRQIVIYPLLSMQPGLQVTPVEEAR